MAVDTAALDRALGAIGTTFRLNRLYPPTDPAMQESLGPLTLVLGGRSARMSPDRPAPSPVPPPVTAAAAPPPAASDPAPAAAAPPPPAFIPAAATPLAPSPEAGRAGGGYIFRPDVVP